MKIIKPLLLMMLIIVLAIVFCSCGETFAVTTTVETAVEPSGKTETETSSHIVTDIDDGFEDGDFSGELDIARLNVHVNTYWTNVSNYGGHSQEIIDADNSAGYFRYGNVYVIADHNTQEFSGLVYAEKGDIAVLELADGTERTYACTKAENGTNVGHLLDSEYKDYADYPEGTLVIYTCLDDATNVFVTCWQTATEADIAAAETLPELDLRAEVTEEQTEPVASTDDHNDTLFFEGNGDYSITNLCFEKGHNYTFYVTYSGEDTGFSVDLFDDDGYIRSVIVGDWCSEYTGSKTISGRDDLSNAYINIESRGYWTIEIVKQ